MNLVIVSGLSGSGKSVALHTLEDMGYYCIDNLPAQLLGAFGEHLLKKADTGYQLTAIGIDARNHPEELSTMPHLLGRLRAQGIAHTILFLEADSETLIKRFSETRRKHPLTKQNLPLEEAIRTERQLLEPLIDSADLRLDTTGINAHQLQELIRGHMAKAPGQRLSLLFQSFGYKHSVPRDADFVFDVRCLPNPYWRIELRPLNGRDPSVQKFMDGEPAVAHMRDDLIAFLERWIPRFEADGRNYLTVAVGCTGGQHRSVYMAEALGAHFQERKQEVMVRHRELP